MKKKLYILGLFISLIFINSAFANTSKYHHKQSTKIANEQNISKLSNIEKIYNKNNFGEPLFQAGYDIFDRGALLSGNSKVSGSYKFNIGDKIDVFFWGDSIDLITISGNQFLKSSNDLIVNSEGSISIPGVGVIKAKDKTSSQIEQNITNILKSKFSSIHTKVTLADAGNFPIIVTGNVKYRGTVYINNHSNLIDILCLAGGVLKTGSLRQIVYINSKNNSKLTLDLYDIILKGTVKSVKFNEGDVIFVKPAGKTIAVKSGVKTPGIYEFKDNETLDQIINFAGGLLPSIDNKSLQIETFDNKIGQKYFSSIPYKNLSYIKAIDGSIISFRDLYNIPENLVYLEGNIKHPNNFQYKEGMKLSDILSKDELLPQSYPEQAIIERLSGVGKNIQYLPVSLIDFFNGYTDPAIMPQDKIKVLQSNTSETVEVSGCILTPGLIPYQEDLTLKKLLGYVRFGNNSGILSVSDKSRHNYDQIKTKNIVVEINSNKINTNNESLNTKINDKDDKQTEPNKNQTLTESNMKNLNYDKEINKEQVITAKTEASIKLIYLYDLIVKNDPKYNVKINAGDKLFFRELLDNETLESVGIFGYVKSPGVYKYNNGMTLKEAIKQANGIDNNGYLKGMVLLRPSIAQEQKKNLEDSLIKLHEDVASKVNTLQSINTSSSVDMNNFLDSQQELLNLVKEKAQKDYGRILVDITSNNIDDLDKANNIELKAGDEIYIPYSPSHVAVIGEVLNNIAVTYKPETTAKYYIDKVGGFGEYAKKNQAYIIKSNGSAKKLSKFSKDKIEPGDTIIVPKRIVTPVNWMEIVKSSAQIVGNIFSSMYILTKI